MKSDQLDAKIILRLLPEDGSPITKATLALKMGENLVPALELLKKKGLINITYGENTMIYRIRDDNGNPLAKAYND
jgi:hypothetical protein